MYSTIVLFLALGYVGVLGQLETTTYVPINTNFSSTFKVNFKVTSCEIVGDSPIILGDCATEKTKDACIAKEEATFKLELHANGIDNTYEEIIFKPATGDGKSYTLTNGDTSSTNIKVTGSKIDETDLNVGFIVNKAQLIKYNDAVSITPLNSCDLASVTTNCVENKATANIFITTTKAEQNLLTCTGTNDEVFKLKLVFQSNAAPFIYKGSAIKIGFDPQLCNLKEFEIDESKIKEELNCKKADCFSNTVTSEVTINTKPISKDLAILLDGSTNSHKMTFKPIECAGFLTSFSAFGLIAAYWIAMMEL